MNASCSTFAIALLLSLAMVREASAASLAVEDVITTFKSADTKVILKYKIGNRKDKSSEGESIDPWVTVTKGDLTVMDHRLVPATYHCDSILGPFIWRSGRHAITLQYVTERNCGFECFDTYTIQQRTGRVFHKFEKLDNPPSALEYSERSSNPVDKPTVVHISRSSDTLARLSYEGRPGYCENGDIRLEIEHRGHRLLKRLNCPCQWREAKGCIVGGVVVADIDGDGSTDVYTSLSGKNEHSLVFAFDPASKKFIEHEYLWSNSIAPSLTDLDGDGKLELVGHDYDFVEPFRLSLSEGMGPLMIKRLENGKFVDVTKQFPNALRLEVDTLLRHLQWCKKIDSSNNDNADLATVIVDMTQLGERDKAIDIVNTLYPKQMSPDFFDKLEKQLAHSNYR